MLDQSRKEKNQVSIFVWITNHKTPIIFFVISIPKWDSIIFALYNKKKLGYWTHSCPKYDGDNTLISFPTDLRE